jgi:hypothetical protein
MIPFHSLEFNYDGQPAYVFYCLWQDRPKFVERPRAGDDWNRRLVSLELGDWSSRRARLGSVLLGERNLGQQTLEILISGYATAEEAEAAFRRQMGKLIRI